MATVLLAVDQGTSSTKAIAFSAEGNPLASATVEINTVYSADGRAEQDPHEVYRSVVQAVRESMELLERDHSIARSNVVAAGIANQRETFVLWDRDGEPLYNAVVWQCKRSTGICGELKSNGVEPDVRARSGLIIDPYFSGTKVTWLVRNVPAVRRAHSAGTARFGTIDSWLLYRLTGGAVHATDMTNASRTLFYNIHQREWDRELQRLLEAPNLIVPEVLPSASEFGSTTFDGVFETGIPITAMVGDSHSAFFGERCFSEGSAKATLGTGSSILLNAGDIAPPPYPSTMSTIGFALPDRIVYALEGIIVSAGSILTWLERELRLYSGAANLELIARSVDDSGGVSVIPGHAGLGAPFWRMDARGSIHGLTFGTTSNHIVRAALESIPYQIRAILDAVRDESGTACRSIRADGGISRNGFVTRWLSDTLRVPVHTFTLTDVTALGAALLAGIGCGVFSGIDAIEALPFDETVQRPGTNADANDADAGYRRWLEVLRANWGTERTER